MLIHLNPVNFFSSTNLTFMILLWLILNNFTRQREKRRTGKGQDGMNKLYLVQIRLLWFYYGQCQTILLVEGTILRRKKS